MISKLTSSYLRVFLIFSLVIYGYCDEVTDHSVVDPISSGFTQSQSSNSGWPSFFPSSAGNFMGWLFSPEEWTVDQNSDKHDLYLTNNVLNDHSSPYGNKGVTPADNNNPFYGWTTSFFDLMKQGREYVDLFNFWSLSYDSMLQLGQCMTTSEFYDPDLGMFAMNHTKYCNIKCGRMIPGMLCCNPQTPGMLDVKFRLSVKGQPERILNWRDPEHAQYLTRGKKIVFIAHGWIEKLATVDWMVALRDAYLERGTDVIIIDWRRGNGIHYWQSMANVRIVGAMIGKAVMNWGIHERTLIVGFSLGAQIAAEAGQYTQANGNIKIDECHGLDPAGPFYDGCDEDIRLDKSDCRLVQVIHTSAESNPVIGAASLNFGTYYKSGHCDFWINCGHSQGPCVDIDFKDLVKSFARLAVMSDGEMTSWVTQRICSHWRAPNVYLSAVRNDCKYQAYPCPDCGREIDCKRTLGHYSNNTLPPFGQCSPDKDEDYYVMSGSYPPYCDAVSGNKNQFTSQPVHSVFG